MSEPCDNTHCPRCGSPLANAAIDGLCAQCLGNLHFESLITGDADDAYDAISIPTADELTPFFPQFEILSCLGRGGMGVVYKARQKSLNRLVALKLLAPECAADPAFAQRFEREARTLASLNHPHIVSIHDFGEAGGYFHLSMEFVDGVNLRQLLKSKHLTPQEALSIITPVCDALECAHKHGIIHRDIKPENILIDRSGMVKIADFGISQMMDSQDASEGEVQSASHQHHTLTVGTPDYASPEQHACSPTDQRTDIYSLGVVLYEMLTGERPNKQDLLTPLRRLQLNTGIDNIILQALSQQPENRFHTAAEFRTVLDNSQHTLPQQNAELSPKTSRRKLPTKLIVALSLLGLGIIFSASYLMREWSSAPAPVKTTSTQDLTLDEALSQFAQNLESLLDARKKLHLLTDESERPTLTRRIEFHEKRDQELRIRIRQLTPKSAAE